MDLQKFNQAKQIEKKLNLISSVKADVLIKIDNILMKTIPYDGRKEPEERKTLRELFNKLKPVIEKHFEEEITTLQKEFKNI